MLINVFSNQTEEKVFQIIDQSVEKLGYKIIRIRLYKNKSGGALQIMLEKLDDAPISLKDCEITNKHISVLLDVSDDIDLEEYRIEVSSCGLNKLLTRKNDFNKYIGNNIKIKTWRKIDDSNNIRGQLYEVNDGFIKLLKHDGNMNIDDITNIIDIPFDNIKEANIEYDINKIFTNKNIGGNNKKLDSNLNVKNNAKSNAKNKKLKDKKNKKRNKKRL